MNIKKINSFLNSMDKSCEGYSSQALSQRQRLQEVNVEFQKLDQTVKSSLSLRKNNKSKPPTSYSTRSQTATSHKKRPKTSLDYTTPKMVIRPAPYPVKNYMLPATELVGPKRYYRSRAAQQMKEENEEILNEFDKYPNSFETSPRKNIPDMIVTPTQTFRPTSEDWMNP